jgi:hypothetical protein
MRENGSVSKERRLLVTANDIEIFLQHAMKIDDCFTYNHPGLWLRELCSNTALGERQGGTQTSMLVLLTNN